MNTEKQDLKSELKKLFWEHHIVDGNSIYYTTGDTSTAFVEDLSELFDKKIRTVFVEDLKTLYDLPTPNEDGRVFKSITRRFQSSSLSGNHHKNWRNMQQEYSNHTDESTIKDNEHHPAADSAMRWFRQWKIEHLHNYLMIRESISSTALSGNRLAQICTGTLDRLEKGDPVSDRYLLGLCWFLRELEEAHE